MIMTVVKMILKPFKAAFKTPMRTMFSIIFIVITLVIIVAMRRSPEQFTNDQAAPLNTINNETPKF